MLSHRSGVAALDVPISNDQAAALDPVLRAHRTTAALVAARAAEHGYHAMTYGFIVSGNVLLPGADEVAVPLNLGSLGFADPEHRVAFGYAPTCGRSCPAGSLRSSDFTLSPKPSTSAPV